MEQKTDCRSEITLKLRLKANMTGLDGMASQMRTALDRKGLNPEKKEEGTRKYDTIVDTMACISELYSRYKEAKDKLSEARYHANKLIIENRELKEKLEKLEKQEEATKKAWQQL